MKFQRASNVFFFLWHMHLIFKDFDGIIPVYGKTAEAFELLEIAPEVI